MKRLLDTAAPWLVPVAILVLWQIGAESGVISHRLLPAPSDVAIAFWTMARSGELWRDMGVSTARALSGFAIGGSIGFVLGVLNGSSPTAARLLEPRGKRTYRTPGTGGRHG